MNAEIIRTIFKVALGITFAVIGFKAVHAIEVTDAERKRIQRRAYGDAMAAWSALRDEDYRHYKKQLRKLEADLAEKDAIIEKQKADLERWEVIGQAAVSGKGGKLK